MGRLFLIMAAALLLSCGCSGEKTAVPRERRICSLSAAAAVILEKLGTPPAAVDQYGAVAASPRTPVIGKGSAISPERLLELKINTLIIWSYQKNTLEHLTRYGMELVTVEPFRADNYSEQVMKIGALTGNVAGAQKIIAEYEKTMKALQNSSGRKKRVYLELYTRNRGAGNDSGIGDLLRAAGGESILEKSALTGTEYIISRNPEVIFFVEGFGSADEIMSRSGFSAVDAVKHKAVFAVPRRLLVEGAFPAEAVAFFKKRMN
ncbi:MAG: ABC transporter substrate-binding protein [Lentisphaeria bacterium]|nr:ABC transporter substrate-binding protein [Lentisphaeria bacterium]